MSGRKERRRSSTHVYELNPSVNSTHTPVTTSLLRHAARKAQSYEQGIAEAQRRKQPRHP